jgi:hypothetical protein
MGHGYLAYWLCCPSTRGQSLGEQDRAALGSVPVYSPEPGGVLFDTSAVKIENRNGDRSETWGTSVVISMT